MGECIHFAPSPHGLPEVTRSDRILADAEAVLRRHGERGSGLARRTRKYRHSGLARKARRILFAAIAIFVAAAIWGFITPLGGSGLLIVVGLPILSTLFLDRKTGVDGNIV